MLQQISTSSIKVHPQAGSIKNFFVSGLTGIVHYNVIIFKKKYQQLLKCKKIDNFDNIEVLVVLP